MAPPWPEQGGHFYCRSTGFQGYCYKSATTIIPAERLLESLSQPKSFSYLSYLNPTSIRLMMG